ncbi:MAG TPA: hypothetical protein VL523_02475 [Terriglobia bacterium]|nr:hypothetical protein [Terriglobia bacterium]
MPAWLARAPWVHIRPRVSLLTGSVLVLLTLYIPVAFGACGPNRTGLEFLRGEGVWPGMATLLLQLSPERGVYALGLALAAFTLLLLVAALRRPELLDKRWIRWPGLASGLLSLFAVADFFWFNASEMVDQLLENRLGFNRPEAMMPAVDAVAVVVLLLCLRSRFLRRQRWVVWLLGIEIAVCLLAIVAGVLADVHRPVISQDIILAMSISPGILYWLVPAGLWFRFGFSANEDRRAQWRDLRPRIVLLYLPLGFFAVALPLWPSDSRPLWGLVPYLGGLCLIFLGYTGLAHPVADPRNS